MTTRIEKILKQARVVLADKAAERWPDEDLLLMLDEGHKDICRQSQILTAVQEVPLVIGDARFSLPSDCWMLTRAVYEGFVLPFVTHEELDSRYPIANSYSRTGSSTDWQQDEGTPEAIVFNHSNMEESKVYPIPDDKVKEGTVFSSPLGVVVAPDVTSPFGIVTDGAATDLGIVVGENKPLLCYYIKNPDDIETVFDDLTSPLMFDTALKYYVIGSAFLTDLDQEYQAKGLQQLGFYNRDLELAQRSSSRDNVRAGANRTMYRRGV